jgi:inner membrane protein
VDNLTHSLVGLASAKAGLDRLSPYATIVCIVSANIADADFFALIFGDRWTLLEHHRGLTHSIPGTAAIGVLIPLIAMGIERVVAKRRRRPPGIRLGGLMIASLVAAATHPLLDWTNNYGLRPFLPWSARWFYGDLVFIVDPYIWLVFGAVMFLLTSNAKLKLTGWAVLGLGITTFIGLAGWRSGSDGAPLRIAFIAWLTGIVILASVRGFGGRVLKDISRIRRPVALATLLLLATYWGALALAHRSALADALFFANNIAASKGERVVRVVAMPTVASPFRWQSVAETDLAMYRFRVELRSAGYDGAITRYEKPTGQAAQLVSVAEQERRAQVLLGFARFPLARVTVGDCVGQTLVQFADLRYTEPGAPRGNFSVNIPVDCPAQ